MKDEKKKGKEKVVEEKGHGEKTAILKLMNDTVVKLDAISTDLVLTKCKNTIGLKYGKKVLIALGARKRSFKIWLKIFSKSGNRTSSETFDITTTGKDSEKVIDSLITKVKESFQILKDAKTAETSKAVKKGTKKAEPKKETFAEATIVEEVPIKEALEAAKKEEAKTA